MHAKALRWQKQFRLSGLVLETDCPYLAPEPFRGRRNDSSYIIYIANRLAPELNVSAQELLSITNENARRLYNM